ncbi:MAG: FxsA family protein [Agarilytica sp.]
MPVLFILFIAMPILEMVILIKVGGLIGVFPTIALVLVTAMLGLALLKRQGLSTLLRAQQKLDEGQLPITELIGGIFLAVGGALLLTPGFVTDVIGFCCLIPGIRHLILGKLIVLMKPHVMYSGHYQSQQGPSGGRVFDAEYTREGKHEHKQVEDGKNSDL